MSDELCMSCMLATYRHEPSQFVVRIFDTRPISAGVCSRCVKGKLPTPAQIARVIATIKASEAPREEQEASNDGGVLAGFFDESGTHDASQALTVGGFIAGWLEWMDFATRWTAVLRKYRVPNNKFHSTDIFGKNCTVPQLSDPRRRAAFLEDLVRVVEASDVHGFVVGILRDDYNRFLERFPRYRGPGAFHLCLMQLLINVSKQVEGAVEEESDHEKRATMRERRLDIHFEGLPSRDEQAWVEWIFKLIRESEHKTGRKWLGSLRFQGKYSAPLHLADLISWSAQRHLLGKKELFPLVPLREKSLYTFKFDDETLEYLGGINPGWAAEGRAGTLDLQGVWD